MVNDKTTTEEKTPKAVQSKNPAEALRIRPLRPQSTLLMGMGYPLFVPPLGAVDADGKPGPGYVDIEAKRAESYAHDIALAVKRKAIAVESLDQGKPSPLSEADVKFWADLHPGKPIKATIAARG